MWLIATFPSKKYSIDNYPAVKNHLLTYGIERLEQTGKVYVVNGEKVKARKKTNNKWYETQDSISYWDDFSKHKLVWTPVNSEYRFTVIPPDIYFNNSLFMITGESINKICGQLNSNLYIFYLNLLLSGNSYSYGSRDFFKEIPVFRESNQITQKIEDLVIQAINCNDQSNLTQIERQINQMIYTLFGINEEEKSYIECHVLSKSCVE